MKGKGPFISLTGEGRELVEAALFASRRSVFDHLERKRRIYPNGGAAEEDEQGLRKRKRDELECVGGG